MKNYQYISDLIRALNEFKKTGVTEFEGLKKEEYITLAILFIKDFPKYAQYDEAELRENFK